MFDKLAVHVSYVFPHNPKLNFKSGSPPKSHFLAFNHPGSEKPTHEILQHKIIFEGPGRLSGPDSCHFPAR